MLFKDFQNVIGLLEQCQRIQKGSEGYLNEYVFSAHNELITLLLNNMYQKDAVTYILNEWLCGNRSPLMLKTDEGTEVEIPIKTQHDLWKAMEQYKK